MPRGGSKPGERRGGRKAGTPNKKTEELEQLLRRMGCDPRRVMALIALNELPCGVCRGKGHTLYRKPLKPRVKCDNCGYENPQAFVKCNVCGGEPEIELAERICMSCYGTLMEACSPSLRGQMSSDLLQYLLPKRKAIEHTGPEGGPMEHSIKVVYVDPKVN